MLIKSKNLWAESRIHTPTTSMSYDSQTAINCDSSGIKNRSEATIIVPNLYNCAYLLNLDI